MMKQSKRERLLAETLEHLMAGGAMNFHLSTGDSFIEAKKITLSDDLIGRKEIYALCRACFWLGAEAGELARRGKSAYSEGALYEKRNTLHF
jgi:hypothetical protein